VRGKFFTGAIAVALLVCSTQTLLAQSVSAPSGANVTADQERKPGGAAAAPSVFALALNRFFATGKAQSESTQTGAIAPVAGERKPGGAAAAPSVFALALNGLFAAGKDTRSRDDSRATQLAGVNNSQPIAGQ
jgi:hypothetical protein